MANFYDVHFHMSDGKQIIKRQVYSEKEFIKAWEDACLEVHPTELVIKVNEETLIHVNRSHIVRIDAAKVDGPAEKRLRRQDELVNTVKMLSDMGF
ncbi:hypothetical protein QUW13_01380 [Enterococcus hirae]|jgi:hypothetical protein|nr:hypothetical protein [Enterococcaceae bacterium]MCI1919653.1 hypothetical protein [Enterococcaceae bacterium]MDM8212526.1 hypothetical protein [Enterococcus hirae]